MVGSLRAWTRFLSNASARVRPRGFLCPTQIVTDTRNLLPVRLAPAARDPAPPTQLLVSLPSPGPPEIPALAIVDIEVAEYGCVLCGLDSFGDDGRTAPVSEVDE